MVGINTPANCGSYWIEFFYGENYDSIIDPDLFESFIDTTAENTFTIL